MKVKKEHTYLAVRFLDVILGSKNVKATMQAMQQNIKLKIEDTI